MKFLSVRAGAVQSSSIFMQIWFALEKCGTDHKDTEQIFQHYKSRSFFSLHYFRKTFSTPFCIELTITSTCSTLLINSKSSMSWLTEPFDLTPRCSSQGEPFRETTHCLSFSSFCELFVVLENVTLLTTPAHAPPIPLINFS